MNHSILRFRPENEFKPEKMEQIEAILWIYKTALTKTVQLLRDNLGIIFCPDSLRGWCCLSPPYCLHPSGLSAGWFLGAVLAACASSALYLVEKRCSYGKGDAPGFYPGVHGLYMGHPYSSVYLLDPYETPLPVRLFNPKRSAALSGVQILLYIILMQVPELIYQSRVSGLAVLSAATNSSWENWIEWLVPNLLVGVAGYLLRDLVYSVVAPLPFFLQYFFVEAAFGLFLTFLMIFASLLLLSSTGTTRRSRVYRYKARSSQ